MSSLWLLFLTACSKHDVPSSFIELYAALRIASTEYGDTTAAARIERQNLMKEFGYTQTQFFTEVANLQKNPELWITFQEAVVNHLDSLRKENARQPRHAPIAPAAPAKVQSAPPPRVQPHPSKPLHPHSPRQKHE